MVLKRENALTVNVYITDVSDDVCSGADLHFTEADVAEEIDAQQAAIYDLFALLKAFTWRKGKALAKRFLVMLHNAAFT